MTPPTCGFQRAAPVEPAVRALPPRPTEDIMTMLLIQGSFDEA
ncbi:hypothetical protein [Kitasatospora griseola]